MKSGLFDTLLGDILLPVKTGRYGVLLFFLEKRKGWFNAEKNRWFLGDSGMRCP
jgi:hypothetical protein